LLRTRPIQLTIQFLAAGLKPLNPLAVPNLAMGIAPPNIATAFAAECVDTKYLLIATRVEQLLLVVLDVAGSLAEPAMALSLPFPVANPNLRQPLD
jgi:hypothetical protein